MRTLTGAVRPSTDFGKRTSRTPRWNRAVTFDSSTGADGGRKEGDVIDAEYVDVDESKR